MIFIFISWFALLFLFVVDGVCVCGCIDLLRSFFVTAQTIHFHRCRRDDGCVRFVGCFAWSCPCAPLRWISMCNLFIPFNLHKCWLFLLYHYHVLCVVWSMVRWGDGDRCENWISHQKWIYALLRPHHWIAHRPHERFMLIYAPVANYTFLRRQRRRRRWWEWEMEFSRTPSPPIDAFAPPVCSFSEFSSSFLWNGKRVVISD